MKKFDINNYTGKYVMHCKTREESDKFLKYLDSVGRTWNTGDKYTAWDNWNRNRENTCYNFNYGMYDKLEYYKRMDYAILEFSDFSWSDTFTKADLKDGMVVEYRNGDRCLVVRDHLLSKGYCINMSDLGDDLKDIYGYQPDDIVKVYDADYTYVDEFEELFDTSNLKLLWEREKKPAPKYKVGDKVRVIADLTTFKIYNDCLLATAGMSELAGKVVTISEINVDHKPECYRIKEFGCIWSDEMFEGLVDYEEMTVEEIEEKLGYKIKVVGDK